MALHWTVDHEQQLITAVVNVSTTVEDMYEFLGTLIEERAMRYAKIFDATQATQWIAAPKIEAFAATTRLYTTMRLGPVGPLAIIVADDPSRTRAAEYVETSGVKRPVRIFSNREEAMAWIASLRPDVAVEK